MSTTPPPRSPWVGNAVIKSFSLGFEDHNILTLWLNLDFGGSGQGFGGYNLARRDINAAGIFIEGVLNVAGARDISKLVGRTIRVRKESEWSSPIHEIGHIVDNVWLNPKAAFGQAEQK